MQPFRATHLGDHRFLSAWERHLGDQTDGSFLLPGIRRHIPQGGRRPDHQYLDWEPCALPQTTYLTPSVKPLWLQLQNRWQLRSHQHHCKWIGFGGHPAPSNGNPDNNLLTSIPPVDGQNWTKFARLDIHPGRTGVRNRKIIHLDGGRHLVLK